jgi:RecA-family ATPase
VAPQVTEVPPDSAEFEAILAALCPEDRALVWPAKAKPNGAGNGADQRADNNANAAGEQPRREYPPRGKQDEDTGHQVAFFIYKHADGQPYLGVKKTSTKKFPQFHWTGSIWSLGAPNGPKIPYRLPELIRAPHDDWVLICAGEKDAETAASLGFVATTNPEGERKDAWAPELNAWFAGRKHVAIVEDNDATGRAHVIEVAEALRGIVPDIRVITFRDLPEHGDLTDWKEQGHGRDDLRQKIAAAKPYRPQLPYLDMSRWDCEDPEPREWAVDNRIPLYQTALFSGEGAAGKSTLLLQECFAHTLMRDWLGVIPKPGPAIFIDAEDDQRELHRRAKCVVDYYDATFDEAVRGGIHLMSFAGMDVVLATVSHSGKVEPTPLYGDILEAAGDIKPTMIGIASSANVFAGNENDRSQVQQFVGLLTRIAIRAGGSVQLISHPSLTGISSDSGISGSTQWHNAVRARAFLKSIKPEAGEQPDNDLREIVFKKNQYGPISENIILRYQNGLFLPLPSAGSRDWAAMQTTAQDVFLTLLRRFTAVNRNVSDRAGANYAPALFARETESKAASLTSKHLEAAMRQLFKDNKIWNEPIGPPSKRRFRLAERGV